MVAVTVSAGLMQGTPVAWTVRGGWSEGRVVLLKWLDRGS